MRRSDKQMPLLSSGELGLESPDGRLSGELSNRQKRFYKGAGASITKTEDTMVDSAKRDRLKPYEVQLKKFNYQQALDAALKTHNPLIVVTVLGISLSLLTRFCCCDTLFNIPNNSCSTPNNFSSNI